MRARTALAALALAIVAPFAAASAVASDAVRVQAEGAAALPPFVPGAPPPPPDAGALRALRQAAVTNGVENAVLAHAGSLAREEVRDDPAALRGALGNLAQYTLGHGVLADLGPREAQPDLKPGQPPPRPRKPTDPVPMEHAWRVEALVDGERVLAALRAAGLALTSGGDPGATAELVLEAPYDAAGLAALRARVEALGAASAIPRRFSADEITLSVRGLPPDLLRQRLAAQPPVGFNTQLSGSEESPGQIRIRLIPTPPASAGSARSSSSRDAPSD